MKNERNVLAIGILFFFLLFVSTACHQDYVELAEPEFIEETDLVSKSAPAPTVVTRNGCSGNALLTSQADVDNFALVYANCPVFNGDLTIDFPAGNNNAVDLGVLSFLLEITGDLNVRGGRGHDNYMGLHNIVDVGGNLHLEDNQGIADLSFLESLTNVGESIFLLGCGISSLMGMEGNDLTVGGGLEIKDNPSLYTIVIDNLGPSSIAAITIRDNPQLSTCAIESICTFLDNGGQATILNNAQGCNSVNQVMTDCAATMECGSFAPRTWPTGIKRHSAKINWDPVNQASQYKVRYRKKNSSQSWKNTQTIQTVKTLHNLSKNTSYEWQVRCACTGGWSAWGDLHYFKTKP